LLVGGPLVAHLVRRRDLPEVTLPTVRFLARALAESQRRRRINHLLLLLVRIGCVVLAALGMAAPFVLVPVAAGDGQRTALALVVDDSRSMMAKGDHGTLLEEAISRAKAACAALPDGSTVTLVLSGAPPRVLLRASGDLNAAQVALAAAPTASDRTGALPEAIALANQALHTAPPGVRRLVVLSDFADHERLEPIRWPSAGVAVEPVALRPRSRVNRRIDVIDQSVDPSDAGTLLVRAQVLSDGSDSSVHVRLERDGATLDEADVHLEDGAGVATLRAPLSTEGAESASVRLDGDDALPADDVAPVLLRAPRGTRVLLVNGDPRPMPADDEVGFALRAIGLSADARSGGFRPRVVDPGAIDASDLEWADVIVLANVDLHPGHLADRIAQAVESSAGLLITGGDHLRPTALESALGDALPAQIEVASTYDGPPGLFVPAPDGDPSERAYPGLGNTRIDRRHALEPRLGDVRADALFADGRPALVVGPYGEGRVALFALPLDDDFGDLPYRPGYLPLLAEVLGSLSGDLGAITERVSAGDAVDLGRFTRLGPLTVVGPGGERFTLAGDAESRFDATGRAGVYRVDRAGRDIPEAAFVVQASLSESDLASHGAPEVRSAGSGSTVTGAIRRSLAPASFLLAGLLLAIEALLRGHDRRGAGVSQPPSRAATTRATPP
jgi:hypothetical protein